MGGLAEQKARARKAAFARRKAAHGTVDGSAATAHLLTFLKPHRGKPVSGYLPIRTEIDPRPAMADLAQAGQVGVPVIQGARQPLLFHRWTPDTPLQDGPFGAQIPVAAVAVVPQVIILPLVAFDAAGHRLGYGGGFYDRTLQMLRARLPVLAVGFAYAAQGADDLPSEPTDQPLDAIVTENGVVTF